MNMFWITNGTEEHRIADINQIPEGYKQGRLQSKVKYVYYTDGKTSIRLSENENPPLGFYKGRIKRKLTEEEKDSFNSKRKNTCIQLYGSETYNNRDKSKQTCVDKYGVDNPSKYEETKLKIKDIVTERYGGYTLASSVLRKSYTATMIARYGVQNPMQSAELKQKYEDKYLSKYKVKYPFNSETVRDKCKKTLFKRYGVDNPGQIESLKLKRISKQKITTPINNLEKYGVPYTCMLPNVRAMSKNNSHPNNMFEQLLKAFKISYEKEFPIQNRQYDFKVRNILIEINPFATHNSTWGIYGQEGIDKFYHLNKSALARSNGYRCIHVWDWDDSNKIVQLLVKRERIYARKCIIKELLKSECDSYLNKYHLQNTCNSQNIRLGLYYKEELVSVMTFGNPRYNKKYEYELLRFCSHKQVIGGAEKLFSYFLQKYAPSSVISYCDNSKFIGNVYTKLNFKLISSGQPTKHWYNSKTKQHITDNLLRQRGFDQLFNTHYGKGTSNEELMRTYNFVEIYDCGQSTYIYKKE